MYLLMDKPSFKDLLKTVFPMRKKNNLYITVWTFWHYWIVRWLYKTHTGKENKERLPLKRVNFYGDEQT